MLVAYVSKRERRLFVYGIEGRGEINMSTTMTPNSTMADEMRSAEDDFELRHCEGPAPSIARCALVENAEYEWATPLSLPGLIVSPHGMASRTTLPRVRVRESDYELIESEDGDIASVSQLPGRLSDEPPCP